MIKKNLFILFCMIATLAPVPQARAAIPWAIIIKQAIKKVVIAYDLMVQRRQSKVIRLQNAQKAVENTMAKLQLNKITGWVKKQRDLYQQYYSELKKVKAVIAYYFRIKEITDKQLRIVEQYQQAWGKFQHDSHFTAGEIQQMEKVYTGMLEETVKNTDLMLLVVKSFTTSMSDVQRLEIIGQAARQADQLLDELNSFNHQNRLLSLSRAKDELDARVVKALYGID